MNNFKDNNDYHSPERKVGWITRMAPGLIFYLKMARIVLSDSRAARQGIYTDESWIRSSRLIARALESVGIRLEVENTASFINLPSPCVFAANHMSVLETFLLPGIIQPHRDITFVVKEDLLTYPIFKEIMTSRRPIVVGRTNPRRDLQTVLREGTTRLKDSASIMLFPQPTRDPVFNPVHFNSLGVKLARRGGVPVIPIAIKSNAWGIGRWIKDFGKISPRIPVHIAFGDPITVTGNGREAQEEIVRFISGKLKEWGIGNRE
ncbi:MAG: lysophospholipid acyltransferase family protein [Candidatus Auribacterota bacterium]|nr:lysophospholipid acyltransferase family protein [Candidatus Auribacterota bacterium]